MSRQITICFSLFALVTLFSNAAEVEWNATGAVNVVRGEDFLPMVASGDPVIVELSYDNGSEGEIFIEDIPRARSEAPRPLLLQ